MFTRLTKGMILFYTFDEEYLVSTGFSKKKAKELCLKGKHLVVERFLKKHPNDFEGAIKNLLAYVKSKNVYDTQRYIDMGFSENEAVDKVNRLKAATSVSLDNFIKKHGEDVGKQKYLEFCKKSAHTEETFRLKHGENWKEAWENYKKSKESRSVAYFKNKYGDSWQSEREAFINKWSSKLSLEGFKEKHGDDIGEQKYQEVQKKKAITLESLILKHGGDKGTELYNSVMASRKYQNTLERYVELYGEEVGLLAYEDRCAMCAISLDNLINKYGVEKGTNAFTTWRSKMKGRYTIDWFVAKYGEDAGKPLYFEKYKNLRGSLNRVSKSSIKFFGMLKDSLGLSISYGEPDLEKPLVRSNGRLFFYDAVDESNKVIFEWNGSSFHYHESFGENWKSVFGKTKNESLLHDSEKMQLAIDNGYRYCVIWDFECNTAEKSKMKIESIKKGFYEKS